MQNKPIHSNKDKKPTQQKPETTNKNWPEEIIKLAGAWKGFPSIEEIRKFDIPKSKNNKL